MTVITLLLRAGITFEADDQAEAYGRLADHFQWKYDQKKGASLTFQLGFLELEENRSLELTEEELDEVVNPERYQRLRDAFRQLGTDVQNLILETMDVRLRLSNGRAVDH